MSVGVTVAQTRREWRGFPMKLFVIVVIIVVVVVLVVVIVVVVVRET
jgi:hypothetical protein